MIEADRKLNMESLAIGLSHTIYINTDFIENSHAKVALMDDRFYDDVYSVVAAGIEDMKRYWFGLENLCQFSISEIANTMFATPIGMYKNAEYISTVIFGILCGSQWDSPIELEEEITNNWAEYVLSGEFKKHCDGKTHFGDDALMAEINKDIYNRIYTILRFIEKY